MDPGNRVAELKEGNKELTLAGVSAFGNGNLKAFTVGLHVPGSPPQAGGGMPAVPASAVAELGVGMMNMGPGDVVICSGVVVWKETASPVSAKYGLRESKNLTGAPIRLASGRSYSAPLAGAYQPADLPPGTYTWSVLVNPTGQIRETNPGDNAVTRPVVIQ